MEPFPAGARWGRSDPANCAPANHGKRLVLIASGDQMYFYRVMDGQVYVQPTGAFMEEVRLHAVEEAARGALGMALFAEATIEFAIGIAPVVTGPAAIAITTVDIAKFLHTNQKLIGRLGKFYFAASKANFVLMALAPTLHHKVMNAILRGFWEVVKSYPAAALMSAGKVPQAGGANTGARFAGGAVAKLGVAAASGKMAVVKAIFKVLRDAVVQALKLGPKSIGLKLKEGALAMVGQLIAAVRRAGVAISEHEGAQILAEVQGHASVVRATIQEVLDAVREEAGISAA